MLAGLESKLDEWPPTTLLGRLPRSARSAILTAGKKVDFASKRQILRQGDRDDHVLLILSGTVKIIAHSVAGQDTLLGIRTPGDVVGEMAAFEGNGRTATVVSCGPVGARLIQRASLEELMAAHPALAWEMVAMVSSRLRHADVHRTNFLSSKPRERLGRTLIEIVTNRGSERYPRWRAIAPLTQKEIGQMAGMKTRSVEQHLGELKSEGVIVWKYRMIEVLDMRRLREIAIGR
jgi:CRP/FNR family cyclic AMP-dependent transcriptional regulator